jgi:hypothetical protein
MTKQDASAKSNSDRPKDGAKSRRITLLRAKRLAIAALLKAEKNRQWEREQEAKRWAE